MLTIKGHGEILDIFEKDIETIINLELARISFYFLILVDNSKVMDIMTEEQFSKINDINYEYQKFALILKKLKSYSMLIN